MTLYLQIYISVIEIYIINVIKTKRVVNTMWKIGKNSQKNTSFVISSSMYTYSKSLNLLCAIKGLSI